MWLLLVGRDKMAANYNGNSSSKEKQAARKIPSVTDTGDKIVWTATLIHLSFVAVYLACNWLNYFYQRESRKPDVDDKPSLGKIN